MQYFHYYPLDSHRFLNFLEEAWQLFHCPHTTVSFCQICPKFQNCNNTIQKKEDKKFDFVSCKLMNHDYHWGWRIMKNNFKSHYPCGTKAVNLTRQIQDSNILSANWSQFDQPVRTISTLEFCSQILRVACCNTKFLRQEQNKT